MLRRLNAISKTFGLLSKGFKGMRQLIRFVLWKNESGNHVGIDSQDARWESRHLRRLGTNGADLNLGRFPWGGRGRHRSGRYLRSRMIGHGDQHRRWGVWEGEEDGAQVLSWVLSGSGAMNRDGESRQ